jgi:hypothetical protein
LFAISSTLSGVVKNAGLLEPDWSRSAARIVSSIPS